MHARFGGWRIAAALFIFFVATRAELAHARTLVLQGPFGPLLHDRIGFGPSAAFRRGRGLSSLGPASGRKPEAPSIPDAAARARADQLLWGPDFGASNPFSSNRASLPFGFGKTITSTVTPGCVPDPTGKHGKGLCSAQDSGGSPFRSKAPPPVGRDGKLARGSCEKIERDVCSGAAEMERRAEAKGNALVKEFLKSKDVSFNQYATAMSGFAGNPQRHAGTYGAFQDFLQSKIPDIDYVAQNAIDDVRTALGTMPFRRDRIEAMKDRTENLRVLTQPDMSSRESQRLFATGCKNGLAVGAFMVPQRKEMYVCPGMVLRSLETGRPLVDSLLFVLAHECTHQCGADLDPRTRLQSEFRQDWMPIGACLQRKFGGNLVNDQSLGEISADVAAMKTLGSRVKGLSPAEAFDVVSGAVSPLCGRGGDSVHPMGDDRLKLLRDSPEIMTSLGCPVGRDSCT